MLKIAVLAVFLSVMQTTPPVPRQAANSTTGASEKIQKKGQNNQNPSTPSKPAANTITTPTPNSNSQNQTANDAEHPVVISKPVPVTVTTHRDWFDLGVWIFSGLLVVIGFLQGIVLWQQRKLMGKHAEHLEKLAGAASDNAAAAKSNTNALETANTQSANFFRIHNRPWVGMSGEPTLLEYKSTKPGQFGFTLGYRIKNFGNAPAFNTVVPFEEVVEDPNDHALLKVRVEKARKQGENIVNLTGDLLLPGVEKYDTCLFSERARPNKFDIPACIVYRFADGTVHYTELSYCVEVSGEGKATFRTLWFQNAN